MTRKLPYSQKFGRTLLITLMVLISGSSLFAAEVKLSGSGWKAWLDREALWKEDVLYLPSEIRNLSSLPENEPTGGWSILDRQGRAVSVPLTMDEYFLEGINTATYEGVSWVWRNFDAPADWTGKVLLLKVEKARMRAEIYINQELAAYDIVGETPFTFDISAFVKAGESNSIAVRLTNPGGRRGWYDSHVDWGPYRFNSSGRNFSTLGNLTIEAHDPIYVEDVFVKNILPSKGKTVRISALIHSTMESAVEGKLLAVVSSEESSKKIATLKTKTLLQPGKNEVEFTMLLSKAELWSPENPALYKLVLSLQSENVTDHYDQKFGVRTFQVLPGDSGEHNFYLNGKRFFFKTAIDWGFYTPTGDYASPGLAKKSVEAAKAMGQNGISFHRAIGEPLVMEFANELGLCVYEEPGGFHNVDTLGFSAEHIKEKIMRMVIRDRNHPSVIMFNLSNENHNYNSLRKASLELVNELDDSRLVTNSSGIPPDPTPHIRPYEKEIRRDFRDQHTAENMGARYKDADFYNDRHRTQEFKDCVFMLGEVNSVTGPSNWYKVYNSIPAKGTKYPGYDSNIYKENHDKIASSFIKWRLGESGSGNIKTPEDVSLQAGRGMMYIHGRHAQSIMCNVLADGFALNGWSNGPQSQGAGGQPSREPVPRVRGYSQSFR